MAYAQAALDDGHTAVAVGNAARAIVEESHSRLAARGEWVLNEKRLPASAGLGYLADRLVEASSPGELRVAFEGIAEALC